jgi:NitT/TauT family transport system substrate-binding protein
MSVIVALDWTPNTNHTGFYVARAKGWYADAGLTVCFKSPHEDEYKTTPASHLAGGSATFACVPSESAFPTIIIGRIQRQLHFQQ